MYSSEDLEKFYFQYQIKALPHEESLQSFCLQNKVPYNIFQKWYKDTHKKVVEVKVDGIPVAEDEAYPIPVVKLQETSPATNSPMEVCNLTHLL